MTERTDFDQDSLPYWREHAPAYAEALERGMTMDAEMAMLDLLEERAYWRMLLARANAQPGQTGASFQRCIDSLDREIAEREAACKAQGCEMHA